MRTNLIQTYMNNLNTKDKNLDIKYELSNRTFIKPLPANGKLVENAILESPAIWAKDSVYDLKSFNHTLRGKGNDHELGKVNDLGMKLGGLVIAGYLMTRKQTPLQKVMELVGLGSFFGAMSLWPKIALQLPARLFHGFNIRQEYEDSYGRKKMFFQDPQYLPWDLMDDEKINKIGDRMGVSKDLPNRRDFIQEKMKKTAIQNNTLWMMTAGFATPIISALICNVAEKPVTNAIDSVRNYKADRLLADFSKKYEKYLNNNSALHNFLNNNKDAAITSEIASEIKSIFSSGFDDMLATGIRSDLDNILETKNKTYLINEKVIDNLEKSISKLVPENAVPKNLKEVLGDYSGRKLNDVDIKKALNKVYGAIKTSLISSKSIDVQKAMNAVMDTSETSIYEAITSNKITTLDSEKIERLIKFNDILQNFKAKNKLLDEYIYLKAGAAPQTGVANAWNEIMSTFPKMFGITDKEIQLARLDRKFSGELLRSKLEQITSDKVRYNDVFGKLVNELIMLENKIQNLGEEGLYAQTVEQTFNTCADKLREQDFINTANRLVGKDNIKNGSLLNIQKSYITNRLIGVRSSMYRLLNTLDFYRRISSLENIPALHPNMPLEVKEEIVEFAKTLCIEGSTSDFITKFYMMRNPKPSPEKGQITVVNGKVINKFLDKNVEGGKVDLPNDKNFFKEIMKLLFENNIHPDTDNIIKDTVAENHFKSYRTSFAHEIGDASYFLKPNHVLYGAEDKVSSYKKFLRIGMAPDQMFSSVMRETFNTRKWLKMFGGFGAGLLACTILAQIFFGKMEQPREVKHD